MSRNLERTQALAHMTERYKAREAAYIAWDRACWQPSTSTEERTALQDIYQALNVECCSAYNQYAILAELPLIDESQAGISPVTGNRM